jgi:hypothetical protein
MPLPNEELELEEEELELEEEELELGGGVIFLLADVILFFGGITYNCERNVIARRLLN